MGTALSWKLAPPWGSWSWILLGLPWALFRFGVAQHPEQAFPVSFQDHSSSSGENGVSSDPHCFLCAPGQAFSLPMSFGAAGLV